MNAFLSKRAAAEADRIDDYCRQHARDRTLFARELVDAVALLEDARVPGSPFPTQRHPQLKRLLMTRSRCHIYFEVDVALQRIEILSVWDARRSRGPGL